MQLTLDTGASRVPQQALLGSPTTRMIAGDLRGLEHEVAVATTEIFNETGISYPREDIETSMFNDVLSTAAVPPRLELEQGVSLWFPDQAGKIDRLMLERHGLLRRLMQKSKHWENVLADMAGNVQYVTEIDGDFMMGEGREAFLAGDIFEAARKAGKAVETQIGQQGNPWAWLDEDPCAFPDPMFYDAMFSPDVEDDDVFTTPDYRHLRPWFLDDVDEEMVAQWVFDHTGLTPWRGSMQAYRLASKLSSGTVTEEDWPEFVRVVSAAARVQELRQEKFKVGLDPRPHQQHLIRGTR